MKYSVAIHKEEGTAFGVSVPDVEGCFSYGDTLEEALINANKAISSHLEILAEDGVLAPEPKSVDEHFNNPDYAGAMWGFIDVDTSAFLGKTEKATVTLPKLLITRIDAVVATGSAKSRSAFLAESAAKELSRYVHP